MDNIVILKKDDVEPGLAFVKCEGIINNNETIIENIEEENILDNSSLNTKPSDSIQQLDPLYKADKKRKFQHLKCKKSDYNFNNNNNNTFF